MDHLRRLIDAGKLRPGDRLVPERELAAQLGVSRPSVRTALRTLAAMRVIESRHGAGTFIPAGPPRLGADSLRFIAALHRFDGSSMVEARRILEAIVASLAAQRATGEDLAIMAEHITGMLSSVDDRVAFSAHDEAFHAAVAQACRNPVLGVLVQKVVTVASEERQADVREPDWKASAERHRQIYLAIRARDPGRAHAAMAHHLSVGARITPPDEAGGGKPVPASGRVPKKRAPRAEGRVSGRAGRARKT